MLFNFFLSGRFARRERGLVQKYQRPARSGMGRGGRGATRLDGAQSRSEFGSPMFEPELFRKQFHCIEESTCDMCGTFRQPHSDSAPPPSLRPCVAVIHLQVVTTVPGSLKQKH